MRHRQRHSKDHNLLSKTKLTSQHLLHSDKSTYFYSCNKQHQLAYSMQAIPLASLLIALLGLGYMFINPMLRSNTDNVVHAAESVDDNIKSTEPSTLSDTKSLSLTLDTNLPNSNTITQLVDSNGPKYITVDFTVEANGVKEYDIYALADTNNLKGSLQGDLIQSINTNTIGSNIEAKQWGYALTSGTGHDPASLTYRPIQTTTSESLSWAGESATSTQYYTLAFAANLTGAKADHYKTGITLSAVMPAQEVIELEVPTGFGYAINAYPGSKKERIYNLQDMTSGICAAASINTTGTLRDTRDDKVYWVTKLADGKCWMTQNLDLDLPEEGLKAADTDIPTDWNKQTDPNYAPTIHSYTIPAITTSNGDAILSYDPGKYITTIPTTHQMCPDPTNVDEAVACGWTDVSKLSPSQDPLFEGIYDYTSDDAYKYNAHYLIGNYYSYNATTAGQLGTLLNDSATTLPAKTTQSICPKGWTLPNGSTESSQTSDFYNLVKAYGWDPQPVLTDALSDNLFAANLQHDSYDIRKAPFYFFYAGHIFNYQQIRRVTDTSIYPTNIVKTRALFQSLLLKSDIAINTTSTFYAGATVRCVAR